MAFNSYAYLALLFPAVTLYWLLPDRFRIRYVILVSLAFYASWHVPYTPLPLLICAVALACGRKIEAGGPRKTFWLRVGIAFGLVVLALFKYRVFLLDLVNFPLTAAGRAPITLPALLLPLGISFYVFESVSYLLDTYQGRVKKIKYEELALFVLFWPHLMAGPLVRVRELIPQFSKPKTFDAAKTLQGMDRLLLGLVQKNLLSNTLGGLIEEGFFPRAAQTNSTIDSWFLAFGFGLQIYFDFASYSNMAIGAAQLLGITLPENFRHPYHASTPPEFWTRWHMTLSRWIRDYLFFPINAKYEGRPLPLYVSLIVIMGLVGLWHGAGFGFILWGVLHGVYLVLYRIWESFTESRPKLAASPVAKAGWRAFTLFAVMAAWIPFRASSLTQTLTLLRSMFIKPTFHVSYGVNSYLLVAIVCLYCVVEPWIGARLEARLTKAAPGRPEQVSRYVIRPLIYAAGLFLFLIFDDQDRAFIYFQF